MAPTFGQNDNYIGNWYRLERRAMGKKADSRVVRNVAHMAVRSGALPVSGNSRSGALIALICAHITVMPAPSCTYASDSTACLR